MQAQNENFVLVVGTRRCLALGEPAGRPYKTRPARDIKGEPLTSRKQVRATRFILHSISGETAAVIKLRSRVGTRRFRFPALRAVEHDPNEKVISEILEAMLYSCGNE